MCNHKMKYESPELRTITFHLETFIAYSGLSDATDTVVFLEELDDDN